MNPGLLWVSRLAQGTYARPQHGLPAVWMHLLSDASWAATDTEGQLKVSMLLFWLLSVQYACEPLPLAVAPEAAACHLLHATRYATHRQLRPPLVLTSCLLPFVHPVGLPRA